MLWFSTEASTVAGSLFSITLKATTGMEAGVYPITVSCSAENTLLGTTYEQIVLSDAIVELRTSGNSQLGDVSGDGVRTLADVITLARYIVGLGAIAEGSISAADVNNDGYVNNLDVITLARFIAGLETSLG